MARDRHGYDQSAPRSFQYEEPKITRKVLAKVGLDNPRAYNLLAPRSARQFMGRGEGLALTPKLLVEYIDLGFTTAEDIETVSKLGHSTEEIIAFQEIGIETAEDLQRAKSADITLAVAKQFIERGVLDLNAMVAMKKGAKVGAGTLTAYQKLDDFKIEDITRLKKAKVSAATVNACVRVGVKTVDAVLKLVEENISGDDIRILGLYPMDDALVLAKMGHRTGDAWKLVKGWRDVGVTEADEIKLMNDRLRGDGPKAIQTLCGLLPDPPAEDDDEEAPGPDWRPYKDALLEFKGIAEIALLIEGGADLELVNWFAQVEFVNDRRYGGTDKFAHRMLKVALAAFTPQEIKALVEENPDRNLHALWLTAFPYVHGTSRPRVTVIDRQRMLDSVTYNVSHDTLLGYEVVGFKAADAAALIARKWSSRAAHVAIYGGYSLAEILTFDPTEEELNLDEIEAESTTNHAPDPADWDWDEETP